MSSDFRSFPPGIGAFSPADDDKFDPTDHMGGFSRAVQSALDNFGRAPGVYRADLVLTATVNVENPGNVVEYIAKFI
jgi:hypothetical protein